METNSQISGVLIPDDISKHQSNPNSSSNLPPSHITAFDLERNLQNNRFSSNTVGTLVNEFSLHNVTTHSLDDSLISENDNEKTETKNEDISKLNPMSSNISLHHQVLPVTNAKVLDEARISAMSIDGFVGIDRNSVKKFHKQLFNEEKKKDSVGEDSGRHMRTSLAARLLKENLESLSSNKSGHSSCESAESGQSRVSSLGQARFSSSSFTRNSLFRNSLARNSVSRNSQSRNSQSRNSQSRNSLSRNSLTGDSIPKNNTNQKNNFPRTSVARNSMNTNKTPNNSVFDQRPSNLRTSLMENITNITPQNTVPEGSKSGVVANIERNSRVRKMSIATRNTIEDIKFLQEEKRNWKDSTVSKERAVKKKRLRSRLGPVNFVLKTYYSCVRPDNEVAPEV
jgi:hypothetical protein